MTEPAAIKGTFSDYKLIKTRKVIQIIVEVPVEQQAQVFAALGYPMPDKETWVGVARLNPEKAQHAPAAPETPRKRHWDELSYAEQAGIRCADPSFWEFLQQQYGEPVESDISAAFVVREVCGVASRAEFDTRKAKGLSWQHIDMEFQEWDNRVAEKR